jgi:CheY-like chemotaxis protein
MSVAATPAQAGQKLIVDESSVNLTLMRSTFEPLGYEITATHSVQEGLALAAQHRRT